MRTLYTKKTDGILTLLAIGLVWGGAVAWAQVQPITGISVTYGTISNTNDNYSTTGGGSAGFPTGTVYNVRFNEGVSNIMYLAGVTIAGVPFNAAALAPQINLARAINAPIKGLHHIVLYEKASVSGTNIFLKTSYQRTMEGSLRSQAINLGADNVFSDQGDSNGNNNNIQRIDYLFPDGIPVYNRIHQRGFLVMDRGGNDRFKIAAITALDSNGKPATFGTPVSVLETQWGHSGLTLDTIVMRGYTVDGDVQHPSANLTPQPLSGVFLSLQALGLRTNDFIYGYSLVANDTTTNGAYWTQVDNPVYFPTNTSPDSTFGGLDLISGGMVFYDALLNATLGDRAWDDLNANGIQDAGEPGLTNVLVYVYDNATNLVAIRRTDTNGFWECKDNGPGTFFAKYFCPTGYAFTARYVGTNVAIDSDADLTNGRTAAITLTTGQTNLTLDAGMYRRATLGDYTWEDANGNGQQDAGEPGLSNVVVRLYNSASNVIGTTTSSVSGAYAFTNLLPGTYFVGFMPSAGYRFTTSNAGSNLTDSDPLPGTNWTAAFTLTSGQTNLTVDAGFYRPASLGDFTWVDTNGNGQQDGGEPGLAGVVVRLYNAASNVIGTTTSSVAGAYAFTNLVPGSYFVGFTPSAGYLFTTSNVGSDLTDSDPLAGTNRTAAFTLTSGQTNLTVDAGFYRPASLGDFTWVDANGNGQQDGGEPGLAGVVVRLYNASSNVIGTTTSSVAGAYAFTNLFPAFYFVGFTAPAGYQLTSANVGNDATDSDALVGSGLTGIYPLTNGQANATIDAGFYRPASLGDYTWVDSNGNGQQNGGEPGLAGVVVRLYNAASNVIGTTTSSAAGAYAFTNLVPGSYFVGFTAPAGYLFTTANVGNDATDSDANPATGWTGLYALTNGQVNTTVDAGFYDPANVSLKLYKSTGLTGNWDFGATNDYYLTIQNTGTVALTGVALSDALPPGVSFVPGSAQIVQMLAVTTNPFSETVSDGFGTVSYANNDGTVNWLGNWSEAGDNNNPASGSVLVRVAGSTNALVFEGTSADNDYVTRTNSLVAAAGRTYTNVALSFAYQRQNWDSGDSFTFYVSTNGFAGQSNLVFSVPTTSGTDASYVQVATSLTSRMGAQMALRLRAGGSFSSNDRINFDFVTFANSGYDVATNAVPSYVPGVTVSVISNLAAATPTNLLVNYTLPAGSSVTVRIRATLGAPLLSTQLVNVATATNPMTPPLVASVTNVSVANAVGDRAWEDLNANGLQDAGEPGITGATVRLYSTASNLLATTTTGAAGAYSFTNLPTGSYFLEFYADDYAATVQDQGGNDARDSDIDAAGRTAVFPLSGGTNDTSRDAGGYRVASLGNYTWVDANYNGQQDGGEPALPNVMVTLYNATSNVIGTTTTSVAGVYGFSNLIPGSYFVSFTPPPGYLFTTSNVGNDVTDSDPLPGTNRTALVTLVSGQTDATVDAGFYRPASLGDFTWVDADVNGQQDAGELGLAGVVVRLYNAASNVIGTTTSSVAGAYAFTNLVPGSYFVGFTAPAGYQLTSANVGNDATDSDANPVTGWTGFYALTNGQANTTVDAGFYRPAALGDLTWVDTNGNGQQDGGEPGLAGVVVRLYNASSNMIGTATSSVAGAYVFAGLLPGTYFVGFTPPAGYRFTTANMGADTTDSDANPVTGWTGTYPLTNGQANTTVDAGFYRPAALGDLTWEDSNFNGQQDIGEPGLAGVVVRLYNAASNVVGTATSSVTGAYAFTNLLPGTYFVGFTAPAEYSFTAADMGNDATDSDANPATGWTGTYTLTDGQANTTVDAGFYQRASIGDFTWVDTNGNGQQDAGEPGLSGVVVRLYNAASNVISTATSSVAGAYAFTNLVPGAYFVGFTPPAGYQFTSADVGNDATDSDANPATGRTGNYVLTSDQANTSVDAGFYRPASLGDFTWIDNNFNGQQDVGEPGLPGVVVRLYSAASNVIGTTTSSVAGGYAFTNLLPGSYFVGFTAPAGYQLTSANVGNDATDSDALVGSGLTGIYTLTNGQVNTTVDAGFYSSASTSLKLYKSSSVTGNWNLEETNDYYITIQNTGTVALTGIDLSDLLPGGVSFVDGSAAIVQLVSLSTTPFTETVSDEFGSVSYGNNDGTTNWLGDWSETGDDGSAASGNVLVQSGALVFQGRDARNDTVTRTHRRSTAANRVYTNCVLSFSYLRINWDSNDSMEVSVSTNGFAGQSDLVYTVPGGSITDPSFIPITANITAFAGADLSVRVLAGSKFSNNDQCHFDFVTITQSGYDTQNQPQLVYTNGMTVNVISTLPTATPTNLLTNYTLPAGTSVTIRIQATLDVPLVSTQFVNIATAQTPTTPPVSATVTNYSVLNSVGDRVWFDANGNGLQDGGEAGLTGVTVRIYDANSNLLAETVSGTNGTYGFTSLPSGSYFLEFVTPSNHLATAQDQGSNDALDSDIDPATGRTAVFVLSGGTNDTSRDAGFHQPSSSIGDFVWRDGNVDGIQGGGSETGMPNVVVRLYDATSNLVATTATSVAGAYSFTNLVPGTYFLEFVAPSGFTFTLRNRGSNDDLDSDVAIATGRTTLFHLPPGTNDLRWDAGLTEVINGLVIAKTSDASSCLTPGDTITYTVTIQNTGNVAQVGVAVSDVLPPGLTYVAGSAQVVSSNSILNTVRDEFNDVAYDNQDGTRNWSVDWQENDPSGAAGPVGNYVGISGERLQFHWAYVGDERAWRWADLSGETNATLSFDWETVGLDANEYLGVQIATNPSGPFVQLAQLGGTANGSTNFDVSAYISISTTIRIEPTPGTENWERGEYGYLDNIEFSSTRTDVVTNLAAAPPLLVSNQPLAVGGRLTVTFQATVDTPSVVTQLLNVATTYGAGQLPISASITNCIVFADVGIQKIVTDSTPDMLSVIEYTLVASNNGPAIATGVVITDVLPPQVQYNSHSTGAYSATSGEWTIGTLAVGASTTLVVSVTVNECTAGQAITNIASVTGRDLFDPMPDNDTSFVVVVPNPGVCIGSRIWFDVNRNGIQDANETNGIANIPVALVDTNGKVRATTLTDPQGAYLFEAMLPGTYVVQFDLSALSTNEMLSPSKQGDDETLDSDALAGSTTGLAWTEPISVDSGTSNLHTDLGITTRSSTRAEVVEVWGEWVGGEGRVAWRTDSEFGTAGFFVYRVDPETGVETRLNRLLLPSAFRESGATYWLADPEVHQGETGTYRLEEKELSGEIRDLGTQIVRFDAPKVPTKLSRLNTRSASAAAPSTRTAVRTVPGCSPVQKVRVRNDGVYGVDLQALADGMGLSLAAVRALAETNGLAIAKQGAPVPAIYDAARDRLVFNGEAPAPNWYVHDSAYLISAGAGRAMPRREPGAAGGTAAGPVQLHFEQDLYLFNMNRMPDDFYFWIPVMSGYGDLSLNPIALDLSGYAGGDLTLKVRLMGWSSSTNDPDHLARFRFNGAEAGSIAFDGQDAAEAVLAIPAATVSNGVNTLTVEGVLQPGYSESFFVVDWVEAAFVRHLEPRANTAFFRAGGAASISAAAFAEPLALALDADGGTTWIADENGKLPAKAWAAASENEYFAAVEADAIPLLAPEPAAADAWFLSRTNRIDYLVVTSRALAPASQELADYRASQGLRVGVAVFEDLCDLMTGGERTPEAIPELLAYAAATWARPPQMAVLMGNGHYDYLGATYAEVNHVPPMLIQTPSGVCAADGLLADAGGDDLPDVALGRLPARTPADLAAMIAKIKAYEAGFGESWRNQVVLVADKADSAGNFRDSNARLEQWVAAPYSVPERIELDALAIGTARTRLLNRFKAGAGFIHYTGHGGLHNYSGQNLLRESDVAAMTNAARPSVAVALSCLVGRFEVPATTSLGEMLMQCASGGAVAVLGPSGLSQNAAATELGEAFYRAILQEGIGRLGPAFLQARRSLSETMFTAETLSVYNLLGDPALRMAGNGVEIPPPDRAHVLLRDLEQTYDGAPRRATATTVPEGLAVQFTYDGETDPPIAAGRYAVAAIVVDAAYEGSTSGSLVVSKATAVVTLDGLSQTHDGAPKQVAAIIAPSGLAVALAYDGSAAAPTSAGTYAVLATVNDPNYEGSATGTLIVSKGTAAVTLDGLSQTYDGGAKPATVWTEPAGLAVRFTYGGSPEVPVAAGTYAVVGTVRDPNWQGSAFGKLAVAKADQTIDFPAIGNRRISDSFALAAAASSGLPVSFRVVGGPAVLGGEELRCTGAGTVRLAALQAGEGNWNAAPEAIQAFDVSSRAPSLEISPKTVNVREAGEGRVFVRLSAAPAMEIAVNVAHSSGSANIQVKSGGSMAFTPANWNGWQMVTLAAGTDENAENETATFKLSASGAADQFVTATVLDTDLGENLAATGGTLISGYRAYRMEQAIDGVHEVSTNYAYAMWTGTAKGKLTLDLQEVATVSRIRLLNWDWSYRTHRYVIEASTDGTTWTTVADASGSDRQGWDDWAVADAPIRYLRFTGITNSTDNAICIPEWEVYGTRVQVPVERLEFSKADVNVREGGEGRFYVRMTDAPAADITYTVSHSSGDARVSVQSEATVAFTPTSWNAWRLVTLAAGTDENAENETATFKLSASGVADQFVTATVLDGDIGENLAATGGTTISGYRAYRMEQAIDGIHEVSTNYAYVMWTGTAKGKLTLDLHGLATVSRIRLLNWDWSYRTHRYVIEASTDGTTWTMVADASGSDRQGWDDWAVADAPIRYLRFTGLTNSTANAICIPEWEVYGTRVQVPVERLEFSKADVNVREGGEGRFYVRMTDAPAADITYTVSHSSGDARVSVQNGATVAFTPTSWNAWRLVTLAAGTDENAENETATFKLSAAGAADQFMTATVLDGDLGENLATTGGTTISGYRAYRMEQAIDGIHEVSTNYAYVMWTGTAKGKLTLDLQKVATVSRIRLLNWDWSYRTHRYVIEASTDGTTWTTVADASGSDRQGWDDWAVADAPIRYLRFTGLTNSTANAICIPELEVYGTRPEKRLLESALKFGAGRLSRTTSVVESEPITVLTSAGLEDETGWNAVDGDDATAWVGQQVGGGYLVVEYAPTLKLSALEVDMAEGSLTDIEYLYSLDAKDWQSLPQDLEENPVSLNFLWLVFPDDGSESVPHVIEIRPQQ